MSNYLYQLVAKNFNLINTVQPLLLSIFEPLPESALLFGEADNSEPSITAEETELETLTQNTEPLTPAPVLEINTSLSSRFVDVSLTSALATETSLSSRVVDVPLTAVIPFAPQQRKFSLASPDATMLTTAIAKENSQLPQVASSELPPPQFQPKPVTIAPADNKMLPIADNQPLTPALVVETNTPTSSPVIQQQQQLVELPKQRALEMTPVISSEAQLQKLITTEISSIQPLPEPVAIEQSAESSPAITREDSAALANFAVEQLGEPTTQFLHNQSIGINRAVSLKPSPQEKSATETSHKQPIEINRVVTHSQLPQVGSSELSPPQFQPKPVTIAPADNKMLPIADNQPLTPALVVETNTPASIPTIKQQQQQLVELPKQRALEMTPVISSEAQLQKLITTEISSIQPQPEPVAIEQSAESSPAIAREDSAALANFAVEQLGEPTTQFLHNQSIGINRAVSLKPSPQEKPATETSHKQPIEINRVVTHSQLPQVGSSELSPPQFQPKPVTIAPADNKMLPIADNQPLTPALVVETNTPASIPTIKQQQQQLVELPKQRALEMTPVVSSEAQLQKLITTKISSIQPQPEPVAIEQSAESSPAIASIIDRMLPNPDKQPLTPAIATETNVTIQPQVSFSSSNLSDFHEDSFTQEVSQQHSTTYSPKYPGIVASSKQAQRQSSEQKETPPVVQVTIGRLEIRATPPPAPPRPKPRPTPSVMSLDDYLRRRAQRR